MVDKKLKIDGIEFNIPIIELPRSADIIDKVGERVESLVLYREVGAMFLNYDGIVFGTLNDLAEYKKLFKILSYPVEYHYIELPTNDEYASFRGYISSVKDAYDRVLENGDLFKGLTCNFKATDPTILGVTYEQYLAILPTLL